MKNEILAHLHDIAHAGRAVKEFLLKRTFEEYSANELLRSAVERKFEVIGEALNRIRDDEPEILYQIRNYRDIVSFRNILVHGYDTIDDRIVWNIIETDLDNLIEDVEKFLKSSSRS
ncbi:MAG: HepT-like ribonuclease domain-containing protein [Verrucomicrobiota bacterium]